MAGNINIDALKAKTMDELQEMVESRYTGLQKTAQAYFKEEYDLIRNSRVPRVRRMIATEFLNNPMATRQGFKELLDRELSISERRAIPHDYERVGRYLKALDTLRDIDASGYLSRREEYRTAAHKEAYRALHEMDFNEPNDMDNIIALADELSNRQYAYTLKYAGKR